MHVFQHFITQRNVTQRKSFYATKSVAYFFYATADAATALAALCKQIETTSIFSATSGANWTNQSCDYVQPMAAPLRNVAVATALRLLYAAFRYVALRNDGKRA